MTRFPRTLLEFQAMFPTEQACAEYLRRMRWPDGFVCPHCGGVDGRREPGRPTLWGCRSCGKQTSLTAGTTMHNTKLPLSRWFLGAYLVASHSNGISALQLQKQIGLGSYRTAWLMCAKLRRAMVDPERDRLSGVVEVDEASIPFRAKDEPVAGGQGSSKIGKMTIIVAVEIIEFTAKTGVPRTAPGRIRIEPIADHTRETLHGFIRRNIEPGSLLITDGNKAYRGLPEYEHREIVIGTMAAHVKLRWSHMTIALLKRWGLGTLHGLRRRYVRRYLDEFVWRFNRRRARPATFHKLLGLAAKAPPTPLKMLRSDPLDDPDKIVPLPAPPPAATPDSMLHQLRKRGRRNRRFLPPEPDTE